MEVRRGGVDDPDFGRVLDGREGARPRAATAAASAADAVGSGTRRRAPAGPRRSPPTTRSSPHRSSAPGSSAASPSTTSPPSSTRRRCSATSGATARTSRSARRTPSSRPGSGPILREQLAEARTSNVLRPAVAYGYFAVNSEGNDLVVWKDDARSGEWLRFTLPPPGASTRSCRSPTSSARSTRARLDYAAFHVVTMGRGGVGGDGPALRRRPLPGLPPPARPGRGDDRGPGRVLAPAHPQRLGLRGRGRPDSLAGLFRQKYRGGRYSWGYEACPNLEDNAKCAELLGADRIGVEVSEESSWQFHPEQTTAAIICHHPQAKYFVVASLSRREPPGA